MITRFFWFRVINGDLTFLDLMYLISKIFRFCQKFIMLWLHVRFSKELRQVATTEIRTG